MTEQILSLLTATLAVIGYFVRDYLRTRGVPAKMGTALEFARTAVAAAEKIGRTVAEVSGPEKYEIASTALKQLSKRVGVKLTDAEVSTLIHAVLNESDEIADALNRREALDLAA